MWEIFDHYTLFLMAFARMAGMILFNPFLSRKSVPIICKMGISFFLAVLITGTLAGTNVTISGNIQFILFSVKELFIGFLVGFVMQLFLSVAMIAGDLTDIQLGVGMSKIYDPQSNVSMPVTGSIYNLIYSLIFFATNGHLTFIKIIFYSFEIIPPGSQPLNFGGGEYIALFFGNMLVLAIKLALPIMAVEIISEIGLGILMRTIPQINIFAVSIQLKLILGLLLIIIALPGIAGFLDTMLNSMLNSMVNSLTRFS